MKTIIAGSRTLTDYGPVHQAVEDSKFKITEVVCGGALGVDRSGQAWAAAAGVPVVFFYPDWGKYGPAAGPIRNREMAAYAEALVAVWDGKSRGTKNMIDEATKRGLKVYVHLVGENPEGE